MNPIEQTLLDDLTRVPGIRSALLVSADDGIVIAEAALDGQETTATAALAANLARRLSGVTRALAHPDPTLLLLQGTAGLLFAAFGGEGLVVVAVTEANVNIGQVRLALLEAAGRLR